MALVHFYFLLHTHTPHTHHTHTHTPHHTHTHTPHTHTHTHTRNPGRPAAFKGSPGQTLPGGEQSFLSTAVLKVQTFLLGHTWNKLSSEIK